MSITSLNYYIQKAPSDMSLNGGILDPPNLSLVITDLESVSTPIPRQGLYPPPTAQYSMILFNFIELSLSPLQCEADERRKPSNKI